MYGLACDYQEEEIAIMVRDNFQEGSRITLLKLLAWATKIEEVQCYFQKFKMLHPQIYFDNDPLADDDVINPEVKTDLDSY